MTTERSELKSIGYEIFIGILSILSIVNLVLIRLYRLLRDVGIRTIGRALIKDRAGSSLYVLLLMGVFVLEYGSLAILRVELGAPEANITTASDAIWYMIVTISTVGYGDQYPVTNEGRVIGAVIIVVGVGIFGTFTGYLADFFLSPRKKEAAPPVDAADASTEKIEKLRLRLEEAVAKLTEIRKLVLDHSS
jgi:hypothetical protein